MEPETPPQSPTKSHPIEGQDDDVAARPVASARPDGALALESRGRAWREALGQAHRSTEAAATKLAATVAEGSRTHTAKAVLDTMREEATQAAFVGAALTGKAAELVKAVANDPVKRAMAVDLAQDLTVQAAYIMLGPIGGNIVKQAAKIFHNPEKPSGRAKGDASALIPLPAAPVAQAGTIAASLGPPKSQPGSRRPRPPAASPTPPAPTLRAAGLARAEQEDERHNAESRYRAERKTRRGRPGSPPADLVSG